MKKVFLPLILLVLITTLTCATEPTTETNQNWTQWRGPNSNGNAHLNNPPTEWSETKNIKWKTAIPGKGSSSPIIWGNQIFITTAIPAEDTEPTPAQEPTGGRRGMRGVTPSVQKYVVMAINRNNGTILWQKTVREGTPHAGTHNTGTWASSSVATDGSHLFAYFGSQGLYCLDLEGNVIWEKDLGNMDKRMSFGEGSSPVLHGNKLFLMWDHEGQSYFFALDKATGKEIWKVERDERSSWSSPLVVEHAGKLQVIASATTAVRSYDIENGELIWQASGMTDNVIPMPVYLDGMVIVMSGFRGNAAMAIRLKDARGDVTDTDAIVWKLERDTPYTPSPLLYDDTLYFLKTNSSVLTSIKARTGEEIFGKQRLDGLGSIYSSPVGASGRVYLTDRDGNTLVINHSKHFEVIATNSLDDGFDASAAIVDDEIFLRGQKNLYCIAEE